MQRVLPPPAASFSQRQVLAEETFHRQSFPKKIIMISLCLNLNLLNSIRAIQFQPFRTQETLHRVSALGLRFIQLAPSLMRSGNHNGRSCPAASWWYTTLAWFACRNRLRRHLQANHRIHFHQVTVPFFQIIRQVLFLYQQKKICKYIFKILPWWLYPDSNDSPCDWIHILDRFSKRAIQLGMQRNKEQQDNTP